VLQPGGDDVVKGPEHRDTATVRHSQHAIVMPVGDEERAPIRLDRILEPHQSLERCIRRILERERADVGDHREARWSIHTIDPVDVRASELGADERHDDVGGVADERDVCRPAKSDD
jgi:hypothetical protein